MWEIQTLWIRQIAEWMDLDQHMHVQSSLIDHGKKENKNNNNKKKNNNKNDNNNNKKQNKKTTTIATK